jgi:integron integrase
MSISLDVIRFKIRENRYSYSTEKSYVAWIEKFLKFTVKKPIDKLGKKEVKSFLEYLNVEENRPISSRNQALNALTFLFKNVLNRSVEDFEVKHEKLVRRLPLVLSRSEISETLSHLHGVSYLMASLLYGSGLRLTECTQLIVKDIDLNQNEFKVYDFNRNNYHTSIIPRRVNDQLKKQIKKVKFKWEENLQYKNFSGVKFLKEWRDIKINDPKDLEWQFVFPSQKLVKDSNQLKWQQDHLHKSWLQKAVKQAIRMANLPKDASCQTLRHSFATHLMEDGYDIHVVQKLLGHKNIRTTMVYNQVLEKKGFNVHSPLDD